MREFLGMLVGAQFLGYMMKTGACPQPGDVKNMVKAAVTGVEAIAEAEPIVEAIHRKAETKRRQERIDNRNKRDDVVRRCLDTHNDVEKNTRPRHSDGDGLSNLVCAGCAKSIEAMP